MAPTFWPLMRFRGSLTQPVVSTSSIHNAAPAE